MPMPIRAVFFITDRLSA